MFACLLAKTFFQGRKVLDPVERGMAYLKTLPVFSIVKVHVED
jgi:hypothetical protein